MKKTIQLIIILTAICMVPFTGMASEIESELTELETENEDELWEGDFEYYINDSGKVTICGWKGDNKALKIPDKINGEDVTEIGTDAFENNETIVSVNVPDTVKVIGDYAFYNCTNLATVKIPDSVTVIGSSAFYGCSELKSFKFPDSEMTIGNLTFGYSGLVTVKLPDAEITMGSGIFNGCDQLKEIPDSVTEIGNGAFGNCYMLDYIGLPKFLTKIGDDAFAYCSKLTEIDIPDSVTEIGSNPFRQCANLETIYVSDDHPVCEFTGEMLIDKQDKRLITYLMTSQVEDYDVPEGIVSIGEYAFYGASDICLVLKSDSYARQYAEENELEYDCSDEELLGDGGYEYESEGYYEYDDYLLYIWDLEGSRFDDALEYEWIGEDEFVAETGMDGRFVTFNEVAAQIWVPEIFQPADLTEEDREGGAIGGFTTEEEDAVILVYYQDLEGSSFESFMDTIEADEDCSYVEPYVINGCLCLRYYLEDVDCTALAFSTEADYVFQVILMPAESDKYGSLFDYVEKSIMEP